MTRSQFLTPYTLFLSFFVLNGCATSGKINRISIGMTKQQVLETIGNPVSTSATEGTEYMNYRFSETGDDDFYGRTTPYYVRIIEGKVEAYGRMGDFDSTKTPTLKIETDQKTTTAKKEEGGHEPKMSLTEKLLSLKELRKSGALTETEYESEKTKLLEEWRKKK